MNIQYRSLFGYPPRERQVLGVFGQKWEEMT
jgi:hypothetical protein